jgi:3-hydroxy-9,10-secoandrosta-1,3,5(10)-triene-9,17-dione monooxygenase reductase component
MEMKTPTDPDLGGDHFREVLGHFPTPVVAVTATDAGVPLGMTIGSFISVSLDPPLVAFCVAQTSTTWPRMRHLGGFCINLLGRDHVDLCRQFARPSVDRFSGVDYWHSPGGAPMLPDAVAWIDCQQENTLELGDHELVVGRVTGLRTGDGSDPLLFLRRSFGEFSRVA